MACRPLPAAGFSAVQAPGFPVWDWRCKLSGKFPAHSVRERDCSLLCFHTPESREFAFPAYSTAGDGLFCCAGTRLSRMGLAGYALSCGYAPHTADGVGELLTAAPEGTAWRAENLRLTRAAEALADTVPEVLPLSDRWDDLCTLALVLGQRR